MLSQVLAPSHVPKLEMPNVFAFVIIIYIQSVSLITCVFILSPMVLKIAGFKSILLFN